MRVEHLIIVCLLIASCALASVPASATGFCHLKQTLDGFVALRAGPSPSARLVGRMNPQDEVLFGLGEKGNWVEATWWRGDDRLNKGYDRIAGKGWVNTRFVEEEC